MDFKSESAVVKRQRCLSTREWLTKAGLKKLLPHFAKESITVDHCVWLHDAKQLDAWFAELKLGVMDRVRLQRAISEVVKARADADALKSMQEETRQLEPTIVKPAPFKPPPALAQSVAIGLDTAVSPDVTKSCMIESTDPLLVDTSIKWEMEVDSCKLLAVPTAATAEVDAYYWQQQVAAGLRVAKPESESESEWFDSCDSTDTSPKEGSGLHPGVTGAEEAEVRELECRRKSVAKHMTERKSDEMAAKSVAAFSVSKLNEMHFSTTNLFVRGFQSEYTNNCLRSYFEHFGAVKSIFRIATRTAFVNFWRAEDAAACIALRKSIPMIVKFAYAKPAKRWKPRLKAICNPNPETIRICVDNSFVSYRPIRALLQKGL